MEKMRVIDPKRRAHAAHQKRRSHRRTKIVLALAILLVVAIAAGIFLFVSGKNDNKVQENPNNQIQQTAKKGTLKQFTGEEFKKLYNSFAYPNTERISETTPITGNPDADKKIRELAHARGYLIRSAPVTDTFIDVGDGFQLQQRASQPWLDLVASAKKDGINLGLTAAYRSAEDQKTLFLQQLTAAGIPVAYISSGNYDDQITNILKGTAIPGYSRHHTGYTVDIKCEDDPITSFKYTECYKWLSNKNYEAVKKHGWIPGYPEDAGLQGPDPETWEYVWVGTDAVTE